MRGSHDFADEKHVVARRVKRVMPAFEPCRAAFDQRRIGLAEAEGHACEAIGVRTRKASRQLDLIVREHVNRVLRGAFEDRQAARAPRQAPDDERRLQRHRVERIGGEADEAVLGARGNDRDTGRKLRQGVAELPLGDGGPLYALVDCRHRLAPRRLRRGSGGAAS